MTDVRQGPPLAPEADPIAAAEALAEAHVRALATSVRPAPEHRAPDRPVPEGAVPEPSAVAREFLRYGARRRTRRRRAVAIGVVGVLGVVVAGYFSGITSGSKPPPPAHLAVRELASGAVVTLTGGTDDLPTLERSLRQAGRGGLLRTVTGGAVEANASIDIGRGATLTITRTALLLRSAPRLYVRLKVVGGTLDLRQDTVTSWTSAGTIDSNQQASRPDITATGRRSVLDIDATQVVGLGAKKGYPGLTWRAGASGTVVDSQFTHDWRCGYAYRSGPLSITGSSFSDCGENGLVLASPGAGTSIVDSNFSGSAGSGLAVTGSVRDLTLTGDTAASDRVDGFDISQAAGAVTVAGGTFHGDGQDGILVASGRVTVTGAKAWSNQVGVFFDGGSSTVTGTDLSANTMDGIRVDGPHTKVTATTDRLDNNSRSGLWVSDGNVSVMSTSSTENLTGMEVNGIGQYFHAVSDTISDNVKDGVALDTVKGVAVRGSTIDKNGDSGLSAPKGVDVAPLLKGNRLADNGTETRIKASD